MTYEAPGHGPHGIDADNNKFSLGNEKIAHMTGHANNPSSLDAGHLPGGWHSGAGAGPGD